jgi:hypothetical protein
MECEGWEGYRTGHPIRLPWEEQLSLSYDGGSACEFFLWTKKKKVLGGDQVFGADLNP